MQKKSTPPKRKTAAKQQVSGERRPSACSSSEWENEPISPTCQHVPFLEECGLPTCYAYPAMGKGWMALCHEHGQKHLPHIFDLPTLILEGQTLRMNEKSPSVGATEMKP
jgi:hypothetical protein